MPALRSEAPSASPPLTQVKTQLPFAGDLLILHLPLPFFGIRAESPHTGTSQTPQH